MLGNANEVDSLSSIPSLDSVDALAQDSYTDSSSAIAGEYSGYQINQGSEQTIPKRINTTPEATLQSNILQHVGEAGLSALQSNDHVTSPEDSGELDLRSDPPSEGLQHEGEFVTHVLETAAERQAVADRVQASDIREQSK